MARKVKTEKTRNKSKKKKVIIALIILLVIGLVSFGVYKIFFSKSGNRSAITVKVLDSLDEYGYTVSDRDTSYYKDEFDKLKKILDESTIDEKKYANQVARLFVNDLYTMSTKMNKYDVGGAEFYYKDKVDMFNTKVMDTLYSTMMDDTYGDREQELPEVKEVEDVSIEETTYSVDEVEKDGYLVKLKWTYKKDMGYDNEGSIVVCKEDGIRWSVVDFQPTLEPEYDETKENDD